jgi:hypothetical protein
MMVIARACPKLRHISFNPFPSYCIGELGTSVTVGIIPKLCKACPALRILYICVSNILGEKLVPEDGTECKLVHLHLGNSFIMAPNTDDWFTQMSGYLSSRLRHTCRIEFAKPESAIPSAPRGEIDGLRARWKETIGNLKRCIQTVHLIQKETLQQRIIQESLTGTVNE